jgi:hypothetical protein
MFMSIRGCLFRNFGVTQSAGGGFSLGRKFSINAKNIQQAGFPDGHPL